MKFAPTIMNPRAKIPLARPSKLPSPRNPRPKWSPSANLDMVVTDSLLHSLSHNVTIFVQASATAEQ